METLLERGTVTGSRPQEGFLDFNLLEAFAFPVVFSSHVHFRGNNSL